jgi:8-oxo-dGTP pyrophosphatase MutT (NUDIX family)
MYILIHEPDKLTQLKSEQELELFAKDKITIEAAGGMVLNTKGELLMMKRKGKWDMPKGKLDEGETVEECAVREVKEETGLAPIYSVRKLQTTFHTYPYNGKTALKPSHWFLMHYIGTKEPIPQTEEDITEIRWVDKESAKELLENAFPSIKEMVERYFLNS